MHRWRCKSVYVIVSKVKSTTTTPAEHLRENTYGGSVKTEFNFQPFFQEMTAAGLGWRSPAIPAKSFALFWFLDFARCSVHTGALPLPVSFLHRNACAPCAPPWAQPEMQHLGPNTHQAHPGPSSTMLQSVQPVQETPQHSRGCAIFWRCTCPPWSWHSSRCTDCPHKVTHGQRLLAAHTHCCLLPSHSSQEQSSASWKRACQRTQSEACQAVSTVSISCVQASLAR